MSRRFLLEGPGCVCNGGAANLLSMEWLTEYPSILLWADSVVVSQTDYDYVCSGSFCRDDEALGTTYALFFERLKSEGLITTFDPEKVIPRISAKSVESLVASDLDRFGSISEEDAMGKIAPSMIETCAGPLCGVALENIYMNLLASRMLGCSCLMDRGKAEYVHERFNRRVSTDQGAPKAFKQLYTVLMPELNPRNTYHLFCEESIRTECIHGNDCEKQIAVNTNRFIDNVLLLKSKPEIRGLSSLIERIESDNPDADSSTVVRAVLHDIAKAQEKLQSAYPNTQRWTRIVGEASLFAASAALASPVAELATPLAAAIGVGGLAASAAIDSKIQSDQWKLTFAENYLLLQQ